MTVYSTKKTLNLFMWIFSRCNLSMKQVLLLCGCCMVISLIELLTFAILQIFIDYIIIAKATNLFLLFISMFIVVIIINLICITVKNITERAISEKAGLLLLEQMTAHLIRLGIPYFERNSTGHTLSLFNTDVQAIQTILRPHLSTVIVSGFTILIAGCYLVSVNPFMLLITFPCFFVYYIFGPYFDKKTAYWNKKRVDQIPVWEKQVYDSLAGIGEIIAYRRTDWDRRKLFKQVSLLSRFTIKTNMFITFRNVFRRASILIGIFVLYWYSTRLFVQGEFSVGQFVAFFGIFVLLTDSSARLITSFIDQKQLIPHIERLQAFFDVREQLSDQKQLGMRSSKLQGDIILDRVSFNYGSTSILDDISLTISAGQKVAIVGKSGEGKSTLFKLISRFYLPNSGDIFIGERELNHIPESELRESIGYVFQETYLFGSSIKDNIRFGKPDASDEEIIEAAKGAYIHDFISGLPDGYDTLVGERGVALSGGQRQRISIARMLLKNPSIVLLDEATSALDNISELQIEHALHNLLEGRTTIAIAHRLSTIKNYDVVYLLEDGKIAESGSYDELMDRKGRFYQFANSHQIGVI